MKIHTIDIGNNEIDYFSFGCGKKTLVIVPGLSLHSIMESADAIEQSYSELSKEFTIYIFNAAQKVKSGYTISDIAEDTVSAMKKVGIKSAAVFGVSQGGMISQTIAINHPEIVSELVLGSTVCQMNETSVEVIEKWVNYAKNHNVTALNKSIFELVYSKEMLQSVDNLDALIELGTDEEMDRLAISATACLSFDVSNELDKIKCPTIVLGAKYDRVLTYEASIELAEKIGCPLYTFEGCHAAYDEIPEYKQTLYDFLVK